MYQKRFWFVLVLIFVSIFIDYLCWLRQASHRKLIQNSALSKTMTKTFQILSIQDTPALSWNRLDILFDKKIQEEIKKTYLISSIESVCTHIFLPVCLLVTCSGNPQQPRRDSKLQ